MEYLLLAVVIIVIGKVVVSPMGKALQEWATKMLGPKGYYACLMEYGLIPGKRWESLGIECGAYKVAAVGDLESLEGGSGLMSGGGSSSGSSGGDSSSGEGDSSEEGGSSEEDSDSKDKSDRKKRGPSSNSGDGSGDSFTEGSGTDPNAFSGRFPALQSKNKNTSSGKNPKRKRRKKRPKRSGPKDVTLKADTNSSDGGSWETGEGYLGRISIEFEDEEQDKPPPVFEAQGSASQTGAETPAAQKQKNRVQVNKLGEGKKGNITDMKPLTLGGYMKWLFIAVLVIAVVLVIGSQILEFQNADT